jgi:hypothetical protein
MPKTSSAINHDNATSIETQTEYAPFFDVIRRHKAYNLYFQFATSLEQLANEFHPAKDILKQYEKEKKKLMKELGVYHQYCKQPGVIIDKVMWQDHMIRPRTPTEV